ncbi:hypothetical protein Clacol_002854 [Clathrus columnatus]|uniref:Uncharacterized protein n=1 Tax=Clathrus columnatus TaxID=1419009 RepID=A0AAV5A9P5_9AGAM|nr:hypothetical protein Clacol_002854 [Clathrus columnatus]
MDDEKDSLFGSPPPSPHRGRSPSLALPEDAGWRMEDALLHTQNVGTIALLGSQNNLSKIPAPAQSEISSTKPPFLRLRPPSVEPTPPQHLQTPPPPCRSKFMMATPIMSHQKPLARKHSERMDRTLSDLVSLIAHFGPTQSAKLHPQGTKENPIHVDDIYQDHPPTPIDAVNNALIALANTVASALKLPNVSLDHPPLPEPAVHKVLQFIKHDPKLIPTLQATHEYLNNVPHYPPCEVSCSDNYIDPSPPKSKRKRKQATPRIPAGAEHWNVPFPFAPGHEPKGYPTQWQLERGRRVLGELLGLFERAFIHSRTKEFLSRDPSMEPSPAKRPRLSTAKTNKHERTVDTQMDQQVPSSCSSDSQRMTEWLSSLSLPLTESIVESFPSTHLPSSTSSFPSIEFSFDDISNIMDVVPSNVATTLQPSTLDFTQLFNDFDWGSLDSIPVSGSPANAPTDMDLTYLAMDTFPPPGSLAESERTLNVPATERQGFLDSTVYLDLDAAESMSTSYFTPSNTQQSCEIAQSTQTIPTASGSSSVREGTPLVSTRPEATSTAEVIPWSRNMNLTQLQRKLAVLLKAQDRRNYLLEELEKTALKKWELQIENGVLQNLKSAMTELS